VFTAQAGANTVGPSGSQRVWIMAACPVCGGAILMEEVGSTVTVYPETVGDWSVQHLPSQVDSSWDEAVRAHEAGLNAATVVMCGRTLESAFDARNVTGGSLQERLANAEGNGLITRKFNQAVSYARLMRNVGIHSGDPVSPESAEGVMHFTQQALRLLFDVPGELDKLTTPPPEVAGDADASD
jgi:hypothetical protein